MGSSTDVLRAMRWALRAYRWQLVALVAIMTVVVPLSQVLGSEEYDSEALVTAQSLGIELDALARYGEAAFNSGEVAQEVSDQLEGSVAAEDVVPELVWLEASQDSYVFFVHGTANDPDTAAQLANVAATEFTFQLNKPGRGVGTFITTSPAKPSAEPVPDTLGLTAAAATGLLAGLLMGFGFAALRLVVRVPIVDVETAASIVGAPVAVTVALPKRRSAGADEAEGASGLVPLCRRLLTAEVGPEYGKVPAQTAETILLVSPPSARRDSSRLAVAVASVLSRVRDVDLQHTSSGPPAASLADVTVVDVTDPADLLDPSLRTITVLVVREGTSQRELEATASDYADLGLFAVAMLVHSGPARPGGGRGRADDRPGDPTDTEEGSDLEDDDRFLIGNLRED